MSSAHAQLSGSLIAASDDRWRGRSLSAGHPIASATIGYDMPSGLYADGAVTVAAPQGGLALIDVSVDAGYAWRTGRALTIDVGATRRQFTRHFSGGRASSFSEIYAGLAGRSLSARLAYSPDYFASGMQNLYASIDGVQRVGADWRLTAHLGSNIYLSPVPASRLRSVEYDAGLGIARRSGAIDVRLDFSFGGPDADYYREREHSKTALVASAAISF